MKTSRPLQLLTILCLSLCLGGVQAQNVGGILKRKANKAMEKTIDKGIDEIEGKDKEKKKDKPMVVTTEDNGQVVVATGGGNGVPLEGFINRRNLVFYDNFNNERATEFPSKWTQLKGTVQNNQVVWAGQKEGVVEMWTNYSNLTPTIKGKNYLGRSFKLEIQVFFHNRGNEYYNLEFKNSAPYRNHSIRIGSGTMHSGNDNISRVPGGITKGWHTIQISFNNGNMKCYFNGFQLINDPDITRNPEYKLDSFEYVELQTGSPGVNAAVPNRAMVNHFAIASDALPLYKRLITNGRLIINDIRFDVNSYVIKEESYGILDEIAEMMAAHTEVSLDIHGHTDSDGTNEFNQGLSEKRANSVMEYLIGKGVARGRLSSAGFGEEKPLESGDGDMAKAQNRRVEFVLKG